MDNSQTVVKAENVNSTAVLDGFVIKDGYSDTNEGVGLANYNSSATIRRCTFINNYSGLNGGAVSNENGSSSVFLDCVFIDNVVCFTLNFIAFVNIKFKTAKFAFIFVIEVLNFFDNSSSLL